MAAECSPKSAIRQAPTSRLAKPSANATLVASTDLYAGLA